jgi:hypothetical protein
MKIKFRQLFVVSVLTVIVEVVPTFDAYSESENQWLCIAEQAAGMHYDEKKQEWLATIFKPGARFLIRHTRKGDLTNEGDFSNDVDERGWSIAQFGANFGSECEGGRNLNFNTKDILRCENIFSLLLFNKQALVFQNYHSGEFIFPKWQKEGRHDTPSIEIGHCSPL